MHRSNQEFSSYLVDEEELYGNKSFYDTYLEVVGNMKKVFRYYFQVYPFYFLGTFLLIIILTAICIIVAHEL